MARNCASRRRHDAQARRREVKGELDPEDTTLDASIRLLQSHIASLERSTLLRDSATLLWRANSSTVAMDLTREYFLQFSRGYDATDAQHSAAIDTFMNSVFRADILCRDFQGIQPFMDQWEKYTIFHQGLTFELQSLRLVDNNDGEDSQCAVTVHATGEMNVTFTEDTLKFLYPALFTEALQSSQAREIVHMMGRVFAFESRVDLVATLLNVLHDPSVAIRVLQSSIMTSAGHWQAAQNAEEVAQRERMLPRQLL
ncbi:hypothetical protein BBJ29_006292 [Phytophthora kernoviae]|uniref:Uncharacterized protein n=1 Tax=Phytophthora kernoviae TaxID=325452 RepID=A0A3F2RZA7_9STRA|nr:hypothetical protein BBJ29_006292 [Phytophthora kernoviae]RLN67221.1 hypothetical protein BBP00_00001731 [Phytophthora kernoviae]